MPIKHCDVAFLQDLGEVLPCTAVEDPFDATDNCARTIGFAKIDSIVEAFGRAAAVMNAVRDDAGRLLLQPVCPCASWKL
jgi:hypothetical protein